MESLQLSKLAPVNRSGSIDDPFRNLPNELLSRIFVLRYSYSPIWISIYGRFGAPDQLIILQVCSRWRQVALNTGALWSNVKVIDGIMWGRDRARNDELWSSVQFSKSDMYARRLHRYRMWVDRAGDYPLTVSLHFDGPYPDIHKVFQDFVIPFRIKKLTINVPYHKLVDLPSSSVEEYAIKVTGMLLADEDMKVPPFMDNIRHLCILHSAITSEEGEPKLKELCLSGHQLRSIECRSNLVSLSTWLNVLRQSGTLQYLERCHLTIAKVGSGPLVGVCMPNLRYLSLVLDVQPDIVIPLIAVPNITTLEIYSENDWKSSDSDPYDVIKRHYNLRQLHQISFGGARFPFRIAQILADAPMTRTLEGLCQPILDTEAREGIASGRLGRCLTSLNIDGCFDNAGEYLDMIETRQRNVKSMVTQASNWREMFTGIESATFRGWSYGTEKCYKERLAALEALGTRVALV